MRANGDEEIYIHESLTKKRTELFWKVKSQFRDNLEALWTQDGRIRAIEKHTKKRITITTESDLKKLSKPRKSTPHLNNEPN